MLSQPKKQVLRGYEMKVYVYRLHDNKLHVSYKNVESVTIEFGETLNQYVIRYHKNNAMEIARYYTHFFIIESFND